MPSIPPDTLRLSHPTCRFSARLSLPASKSESNRALIISALSGQSNHLANLSTARDTQTMQRLLDTPADVWDVQDAGTTIRFLTALAAITNRHVTLTGTPRMQQRPIGILVDGLRALGAKIDYVGQPGYPPLRTEGFDYAGTHSLTLPGQVSSQFVSALLMVGPCLPDGLTLHLTGPIYSRPYIDLTCDLMRRAGAEVAWVTNQSLRVSNQPYRSWRYSVQPDWSAASYWYSAVALAQEATVTLLGLRADSAQGDRRMAFFGAQLGVETVFTEEGATLRKGTEVPDRFEIDFRDCPDLAQTVLVAAAGRQQRLLARGLESLRIKETDRVVALQRELNKVYVTILEESNSWELLSEKFSPQQNVIFDTYEDHRMAMSLAPLALMTPVILRNPTVVEKSYPHFWEDCKQAGFTVERH